MPEIQVNPDWWKDIFDEIYLMTDARSVCDSEITKKEINIILDLLSVEKEGIILDLCGGHGRHSLELLSRGYNCILFDYSRKLLDVASAEAEKQSLSLKTIQGDARETRFSSDSFDYVLILGNSFGYIADEDSDNQILQEAWRILKPGGRIMVDITDGKKMRENFLPISWHEIGEDTIVCRKRELNSEYIITREIVLSKEKGLIRDLPYKVKLYTSWEITKLLHVNSFLYIEIHDNFFPHKKQDDYGFMNHRLIAIGCKPW